MSILNIEEYKSAIRQEKYNQLKWSKEECLFSLVRLKHRNPHSINHDVPLSLILDIHIKLSCFGPFMKSFNEHQVHNYFWYENKLGIDEYNLKNFSDLEKNHWDIKNNFSDDLFELLRYGVENKEQIDYDFLQRNLTTLRLSNGSINKLDSLRKYTKLQVLVIAANWIKIIRGKYLPRPLQFLECYANEMASIRKFCRKPPKGFKYLGFGRNNLTNNSCLHLLPDSGNFEQLRVLDLSNNNIVSLVDILDDLKDLTQLKALALEGNPCYTCEAYKENLIDAFPKLLFLDGTEITVDDRKIDKNCDLEVGSKIGALIFTCYRIIGMPQPPKGKVSHNFYLEIETPLLDVIKTPRKPEPPPVEPPPPPEPEPEPPKTDDKKSKKGKKDDKKEKKEKKEKKSKSDKSKGKKKEAVPKAINGRGLYGLPNEYKGKEEVEDLAFKSEERPWSKNIVFNNPSIIITAPNDDLTLLRNTIRSKVPVKIMYIQKLMPKPAKKGGKDKGKGKSEKSKSDKSKKSKGSSKSSGSKGSEPSLPEPEVILKISTFATMYCSLSPVNWSDTYVDYIWADHKKVGKNAIQVNGSLKPEIYEEKGKGKGKKDKKEKKSKSGKTSKSSKATSDSKATIFEKSPMPKFLTCNFGFGLKRHGMVQEIVKEISTKGKGKGKDKKKKK